MRKKTSIFAVLLALALLIASLTPMTTAFDDESDTDLCETVHGQNDLEGEEGDDQFTILETAPDPPENLDVEHTNVEFLYPAEEIEIDNLEGEIGYLQHDPESDAAYDNWYEAIENEDTELHVGMDAPAEEADGEQTIGVLLKRTDNSDRTPEVTIELYQDGTLIDTLADELEIEDPVGEVHHFNFDAADLVDPSGEGVTIELSADRTGGPGGDRNTAEYGAVEWEATTLGESDGTEDNLVTWDASLDDPDNVVNYHVYRSEEEDGDYEYAGSVEADGSAEYEFIDEERGTADDILWWYTVRAEDDEGQESEDATPAREPGPLAPTEPQPEDGATGVGPEEVELSVYVNHSKGEITDNVTFYNASDDSVIGSVEDVENDTRTENITWEGLEPDQTYEWYTVAEDPGGTVQSETWEFTTDEVEVSEVVIDPAEDQVVQAGDELNFTAKALDELGTLITDNVTDFTWYNISKIDGEENVTIFSEEDTGEYDVIAEYEDVSNSTTVTVEPADPAYIVIEPEEYTVVAGEEVNYTSTAYDEFDNEIGEVTEDTNWSIEDGAGGEWNQEEGIYTSENTGDWNVTGGYENETGENLTDTANLTVVGEPEGIIISPPDETITAGDGLPYNATAYDGEDNEWDVTDETEWSDDIDDSEWEENELTAYTAGEWIVTGNYTYDGEDITNTTDLEVVPAEVDYIEIEPAEDQVITAGDTINFEATAYDESDNVIEDEGAEFTWENTDGKGFFDETEVGEYDVTATYDEVTSPITTVTVDPAGVDYVEIDPEEDQDITAGEEIDFDAKSYDEYDNAVEYDDEEFTWENTDGTGLFDETEAGDYDVTATYDEITSPITVVTVEPAEVDYVDIDAEEETVITAGETIEFKATAFDQYENVVEDDDEEFTWQNTDETGLFDNTTAGDYDVTATHDEETSQITTVTVEPGELESMEIVDYPDNLTAGESFQMSIGVYDEYGNLAEGGELENFTINSEHDGEVYSSDSVTFDQGLHVAEVSEDQVITADAEHNITVSSNPNASIQIMIEPGDVDDVVIHSEESTQIDPGEQVNFTAEAKDEYGNLITNDVTEFNWTNIDELDEENNIAIFYQDEEGEVEVTVTYEGETIESDAVEIEEAAEEPASGLSPLRSLWWLWLVAVILILLIGGSFWRKSKKEVDKSTISSTRTASDTRATSDTSDTSDKRAKMTPNVKIVRKKVKKPKVKPAEKEEMSEEAEEELTEEKTVEEEQREEAMGEELDEEAGEEEMVEEGTSSSEEVSKSEAIDEFQKVKGIGPATAENLYEKNFENLEQLKEASVEELTEVKGIGESTAQKIFENLKE